MLINKGQAVWFVLAWLSAVCENWSIQRKDRLICLASVIFTQATLGAFKCTGLHAVPASITTASPE